MEETTWKTGNDRRIQKQGGSTMTGLMWLGAGNIGNLM
jgi:hypothetical protein